MDERDIIEYLNNPTSNKTDEVLNQLRKSIRYNNGQSILPFDDPLHLFSGLVFALMDDSWETKHQCIKLIEELVPLIKNDIDQCMQLVLPCMVSLIAHSKVTLSSAVAHALNTYASHTGDFQLFLQAIVQHGIETKDSAVRKTVIKNISLLLPNDNQDRNLSLLVQSLLKCLSDDRVGDEEIQESIQFSLEKIAELVGQKRFNSYIDGTSESLRQKYYAVNGKENNRTENTEQSEYESKNRQMLTQHHSSFETSSARHQTSESEMIFGLIPTHIVLKLREDVGGSDHIKALDEMKRILREALLIGALVPHLSSYFDFLKQLTDEKPALVSTTLEIVDVLVGRLGISIRDNLRLFCNFLSHQMSDNNLTVHSHIVRIALRLMQILPPKLVLPTFLENLSNKNFHIRQKTLNVVIAALLTHPSNDFDLGRLCQSIVRTLIDPKKLVRQASLECFAVIAQAMGPGKQQQLIAAVDSLEQNADADGVMAAVQARLARRQLPTFTNHIIEYATQNALNSSLAGSNSIHMIDIDWILSGSNGSFSAGQSSDSLGSYKSIGSSGSNKMSVKGLLENQQQDDQWATKYEKAKRLEDSGRPLRHHNSAQFPLRTVEPSPDRNESGRVSALDFRSWENIEDGSLSSSSSSSDDVSRTVSSHLTVSLSWPSPNQMLPESLKESSPTDSMFVNSGHSASESHPFHTKPMPVRTISSSKNLPLSSTAVEPPPVGINALASKRPFESENQSLESEAHVHENLKGEADHPQESQEEINNSLKQIRHSASKKQLNRLFQKQESREAMRTAAKEKAKTEQQQHYSSAGDKGHAADAYESSLPGFHNTASHKKTLPLTSYHHMENVNNSASDFNGQDSWSSNVAVVGRGYTADDDDTVQQISSQKSPPLISSKRIKETRRSSKALPLSPLDSSGLPVHGSIYGDALDAPTGIVGKAAFPTSAGSESFPSSFSVESGHQNLYTSYDERPIRGRVSKASVNLPSAVYGSSVRNEMASLPSVYNSDSNSMIDAGVVVDKGSHRQSRHGADWQQTEAAEKPSRPYHLNGRRLHRHDRHDGDDIEIGRHANDDSNISSSSSSNSSQLNSCTVAGAQHDQPIEIDNSLWTKKKQKRKTPAVQVSNSLSDSSKLWNEDSVDESGPLGNAPIALNQAVQYLNQEHWEDKIQGLSLVRRLAFHHEDVLLPDLGRVLIAVGSEVKNLRSKVSCEAIVCMSDLFTHLKRNMDLDLDRTTAILLSRTGDQCVHFIRVEAQKALAAMVDNVSAQKAIAALTAGGAGSRSSSIRSVTAEMIERLIIRLGPEKIFSGNRDLADRILPVSAQFLQDASPDVRSSGQRIFRKLLFHQDFDRIMKKSVSEALLRNIQDKLEYLRQKDPADSTVSSSRSRRLPVSENRGNAAIDVDSSSSLPPVTTPSYTSASSAGKKKPLTRMDDSSTVNGEVQSIVASLSSSDWRQRCDGVEHLQQFVEGNSRTFSTHLTKVFIKFIPCLHDSNSKLNLYALQVLLSVMPSIGHALASSSILNLTVQTVISNLTSKNQEIFATASDVLDSFENTLDPSLLLVPYVSEGQKGKVVVKSKMTQRLSGLLARLEPHKTSQALMQLLPFVWHLLSVLVNNAGGGKLQSFAAQLISNVSHLMGENGLVSTARAAPTVTLPMQELLTELLLEAA